jgi:hypothetical protein
MGTVLLSLLGDAPVTPSKRYALFIHCPVCDAGHDLDERVSVASAEVATFVAAHPGHDRLALHLRLPDVAERSRAAS